jgi:DNA topoisomerase IA
MEAGSSRFTRRSGDKGGKKMTDERREQAEEAAVHVVAGDTDNEGENA